MLFKKLYISHFEREFYINKNTMNDKIDCFFNTIEVIIIPINIKITEKDYEKEQYTANKSTERRWLVQIFLLLFWK